MDDLTHGLRLGYAIAQLLTQLQGLRFRSEAHGNGRMLVDGADMAKCEASANRLAEYIHLLTARD